jgi:hypothetical protein
MEVNFLNPQKERKHLETVTTRNENLSVMERREKENPTKEIAMGKREKENNLTTHQEPLKQKNELIADNSQETKKVLVDKVKVENENPEVVNLTSTLLERLGTNLTLNDKEVARQIGDLPLKQLTPMRLLVGELILMQVRPIRLLLVDGVMKVLKLRNLLLLLLVDGVMKVNLKLLSLLNLKRKFLLLKKKREKIELLLGMKKKDMAK